MKSTVELVLAIVSGLCGMAAAILVLMGYENAAAFTGGIGLALCNVIWILRLT
jgi:hypothetical protein